MTQYLKFQYIIASVVIIYCCHNILKLTSIIHQRPRQFIICARFFTADAAVSSSRPGLRSKATPPRIRSSGSSTPVQRRAVGAAAPPNRSHNQVKIIWSLYDVSNDFIFRFHYMSNLYTNNLYQSLFNINFLLFSFLLFFY